MALFEVLSNSIHAIKEAKEKKLFAILALKSSQLRFKNQ